MDEKKPEVIAVIDESEKQAFFQGLKKAIDLVRAYGANIGVPEYAMVANAIILMINAYIHGINSVESGEPPSVSKTN